MDPANCAESRLKKRFLTLGLGVFPTTGFTLLEVLVTLTILGFILVMIYGVFHLGLSAWEKGDSIKEKYQKVRILSQLISRQIKSAVPYKIKTQKAQGDYLAFEGKARSLKFVSALPLKTRRAQGLVYVIYELKEGRKTGSRLVLYETRVLNRDFMDDEPKEESEVSLLEEVSDVRFEYYREEDPNRNQAAGWTEEWNAKEEAELPRAIRMTITGQSPLTLMASLPSYRYEEVKVAPTRKVIPRR